MPSNGAASTLNQSAMRLHIHCQRKTSPLTALKASLCAASVSGAQRRCRAIWPASVMSVSPDHWAAEPEKVSGRPFSRHRVAYTASVVPMFMALPTALPITVWGRCTLQVKPSRAEAANTSSSWA